MTDLSPDFNLGEYSSRSVLESVEYTQAITDADIGKPLKVVGTNSAGQLKVAKQTGETRPTFIIIKGGAGKVGDIKTVLFKGDIKAKIGSAVGAGFGLTAKDGKIVVLSTGSSYTEEMGFLRTATAADGDTALVCWG